MSEFEPERKIEELTESIAYWFSVNGPGRNAFVGLSGGKDSFVTALLCIKALGASRVIGVGMPMNNYLKREVIGENPELAKKQAEYLGIRYYELDILPSVQSILGQVKQNAGMIVDNTLVNLPARIRMATLYAFAQSGNGRVACTSNRSEDYIGWNTRWGDNVGDFQPLGDVTATEVWAMLPYLLKDYTPVGRVDVIPGTPKDGLCGKDDETAFGFSYEVLDKYITTGECDDPIIKTKIDNMHEFNAFKMRMPTIL